MQKIIRQYIGDGTSEVNKLLAEEWKFISSEYRKPSPQYREFTEYVLEKDDKPVTTTNEQPRLTSFEYHYICDLLVKSGYKEGSLIAKLNQMVES